MRMMPSPRWDGRPFNMPTGIAAASSGQIFVSDGYGGHRVHRFSADGELQLTWGEPGAEPGQFALLHNIGVDSRGRILICDRENDRIQLFDEAGRYLDEWTAFTGPADVYIRDDIVYVAEQFRSGGVSIRTLDGGLITRWRGDEGPGKGTIESAHGICVDSEGSIYVTELGADRVQKFARV